MENKSCGKLKKGDIVTGDSGVKYTIIEEIKPNAKPTPNNTTIKCEVCNKDMLGVDKNAIVSCGLLCRECSKPQIIYPPQANTPNKMIEVELLEEIVIPEPFGNECRITSVKIDPTQPAIQSYLAQEIERRKLIPITDAVKYVEIDEDRVLEIAHTNPRKEGEMSNYNKDMKERHSKICFQKSGQYCWETPQDFFNKLNEEFKFNLDACANDDNYKISMYFTEKDDGLSKSWTGYRVWMNPPYGLSISKWVKKAYEEVHREGGAELVVCLLPVRTDTRWWWDYCVNREVRFIKGRLKFKGRNTKGEMVNYPATFPSVVVIFNKLNHPKQGREE